jgi:hypothetical protein
VRAHALILHDLERREKRTRCKVGFRDDNDRKERKKKTKEKNDFYRVSFYFFLLSTIYTPALGKLGVDS